MAESDDRVCPRCGVRASGDVFCTECGFDLKAHGELPTRAEWLASRDEGSAEAETPSATDGTEPPGKNIRAQGPDGAGAFWRAKWFAVVILALGLGLSAFGVVRILAGDSEVTRLENELSSLEAEQSDLEGETAVLKEAAAAADDSLQAFVDSVEASAGKWGAMRGDLNTLVTATDSATTQAELQSASRAFEQDLKQSAAGLEGSLKETERSLSLSREAVSELETAVETASAGEE